MRVAILNGKTQVFRISVVLEIVLLLLGMTDKSGSKAITF